MEKLSIVVPIYNVSNYLRECLDSFFEQGISNYEVIMVDDGSTDNSYEIAEEYARHYGNFFAYTKPNQGLGHSRNFGAEKATGKYLTFVDSDDIIPENSYKEMLEVISRTGSDFIIGNVRRFNSTRDFDSVLHKKVFKEDLEKVNIKENLELMYDTTAWNKIYNLDFWKKNKFEFPEGMLYEDIPVTIPSHILASNVDVITKVTYLWRARDKGDNSITQQRSDIKNLSDRLKAIQMTKEFIEANNATKEIKNHFDFKNLDMDFVIYLNYLGNGDEVFDNTLISYIKDYLKSVDPEVFKKIPVIKRLKYRLIENNKIKEFQELLAKEQSKDINWKPILKGDKYVYDFPFIDELSEDEQIIQDELSLVTRIEEVKWIGNNQLNIKGFAYIYKIDSDKKRDLKCTLSLINEQGETVYEINNDVELKPRKDVTTLRGVRTKSKNPLDRRNNYKYSGIDLVIDINEILTRKLPEGNYYLDVSLENTKITRNKNLGSPASGFKTKPRYRIIDNKKIAPRYNQQWEFYLEILDVEIEIDEVTSENGMIQVFGKSQKKLLEDEITFAPDFYTDRDRDEDVGYQRAVLEQSDNTFKIICNLENIVSEANENNYEKYDILVDFGTEKLALAADKQNKLLDFFEDKQIRVDYNNKQQLKLSVTPFRAYIQDIDFKKNNIKFQLKIHTNYLNGKYKENTKLTFKSIKNNEYVSVNSTVIETKGDYDFITFDVALFSKKELNLIEKSYEILLTTAVEEEIIENEIYFFSGKNDEHKYIYNKYRFNIYHRKNQSKAYFSQQTYWSRWDDGPRRQAIWRELLYKAIRKLPTKNIAVFESYWGREFGCNPQAIYEYMEKNYPSVKNVVFLKDDFNKINGNAETVKINSWKYYYYLARARYLFNNVNFPDFYKKRADAIEVQTMHGTPLKRLGLDSPDEIKPNYIEKYIEKNNRWDYLTVPSDYVAEISKSAFQYGNEILNTGYPRNDALFKDNNEQNILRLKEKYNIPLNKKIVLYAPTWRIVGGFSLAMDIEKMKEMIGDEYFILIKLHHYSYPNFSLEGFEDFAIMMDNDIRELYILSDVLITDYSSVMFDFSLLNKPMLFYVYDYEKYKNELRGFYLDFANEAPGELLYTTDDLIEALANIEEYKLKSEQNYKKFQEKFNQYDNGHAAEKLLKRIMK